MSVECWDRLRNNLRSQSLISDAIHTFYEAVLVVLPPGMLKGRSGLDPEERPEDILLFAYVDGELDEEQRRLVEDLLARDPDARQRVAQIRELNALLKAAYDEDGGETT